MARTANKIQRPAPVEVVGGITAQIAAGDIEIGAVELKNATNDDRAKVAATGSIAEGDIGVAVQAPVLGKTSDSAVVTDTNGTVAGFLRGLIKLIVAKITVHVDSLPAITGAVASVSTVADGADITQGALADAAVGDASGSVNAHLRQLVKTVVAGTIAAGQAAMGASLPVAIANNQTPIPTTDAGLYQTASFGVAGAAVVSADMTTAAHVTDAPTAGQKIVITDILISTDTAMSILLEDHGGTDIFNVYMGAYSTLQITPRAKLKLDTADEVLTAKASVTGNVCVLVTYHSEA